MNFLESIQKGIEAAKQADSAKSEVMEVFRSLNNELKALEEANVSVFKGVSVAGTMEQARKAIQIFSGADPDQEYLDADRLLLQVQSKEGGRKITIEVAKWRQHVNGFPCVISFEGNTFNCFSTADLEDAFKALLSSTTFGRSLNQAMAQVAQSGDQGEQP